ncbi:MAG: type I restriction endonuclease [Deltaproteobacteria bacterium]|nr:type I restriction endonuclease [Deltaproteobacteria bacterium]
MRTDAPEHRDLARRRAIVALSAVGAASMVPPSLLQLGVVRDLPDPNIRWFGLPFSSKKVNLSKDAFVLGVRDAPLALAGFVANVPLAVAGGEDRATSNPWLPIAAALEALGEAIGAAVFFAKMPRKERAWCPYCVVAAFASFAVFALTFPEGLRAGVHLLRRRAQG